MAGLGGRPGSEDDFSGLLSRVSFGVLREAFDASPLLVTITAGPDHRLVWRSRGAIDLYGALEDGRPLAELIPESADALAAWDRAFGGELVRTSRHLVAPVDTGGRRRAVRYCLAPIRSTDGAVIGVIQLATDATAEAEAEERAVRSSVLADISTAQSTARDATAALQAVADTLIPEVADLAAVYVLRDFSAMRSSEVLTPVALALSAGVSEVGRPPQPPRRAGARLSRWESLLTSGVPVAIQLDAPTLEELNPNAEMRAWLMAVNASSIAVAPLVVAGELTGAVLLLGAGDRTPYDERDLVFLREIADRSGATIAEVRARQRNRDTAKRLRRTLLPTTPPKVAGAEVAARYLSSDSLYPVGGDWWALVELPDGNIGFGIGDISGHGLGAAALMGQARAAMRTAARAALAPVQVLALVDEQLGGAVRDQSDADIDLHHFATAVYAVTDRANSSLRVASAGHLPLLIRPAGAPTRTIWAPSGPPLGVGGSPYEEIVVPVRPRDTIVAYTDGLVESRTVPVSEGIAHLAAALDSASRDDGPESVADILLSRMVEIHSAEDDDIALLVIRLADSLLAGQP